MNLNLFIPIGYAHGPVHLSPARDFKVSRMFCGLTLSDWARVWPDERDSIERGLGAGRLSICIPCVYELGRLA